jgi:cytochrome c2
LVLRVWFLILLLGVAALNVEATPAATNLCLDCHPVHYAERASCVGCHRGEAGTRRIEIAHSGLIAARFAAFTIEGSPVTRRGEQLLKDYACRRCHVSAGKGNSLAASLDPVPKFSTPEELAAAIKSPVLFMPEFHFSETQRIALVNAIFAGARRVEAPSGEVPTVIHFEGNDDADELRFEKHCGACHRVLTARFGGLGNGLIGPNLSGLFTEFYFRNFGVEEQAWSVERLEKWLKNPRKIRPLTQMPPVRLENDEFDRLSRELQPLVGQGDRLVRRQVEQKESPEGAIQ